VMFDETGQASPTNSYWISSGTTLGNTLNITNNPAAVTGNPYGGPITIKTSTVSLYSSPAVCIYDETAFTNQISSANGGSGLAFNDGNNNTAVYYSYFASDTAWTSPSSPNLYTGQPTGGVQYIYLNQQVLSTFPHNGYLTSANAPNTITGEIDQANEAQWLNTNGQIYAIKPNDGSLLKGQ